MKKKLSKTVKKHIILAKNRQAKVSLVSISQKLRDYSVLACAVTLMSRCSGASIKVDVECIYFIVYFLLHRYLDYMCYTEELQFYVTMKYKCSNMK